MGDEIYLRERVWVRFSEGIAEVTLSRPIQMNALDLEMIAALIEAIEIVERSDARAVVLNGAGRAFCTGLDLSIFSAFAQGSKGQLPDLVTRTQGVANDAQKIAVAWRQLPVPVFAAVHGVAFGGGLQIALGADVRFVAPDARLSVMEIKWGMVPDMGGMALLGSLVRDDHLRELMFTGRVVEGTEAVSIGLATRVADNPLVAARDAARASCEKSPSALSAAKRLINMSALRDLAEILDAESNEQQVLLTGVDLAEATSATIQKRSPVFELRRMGKAL